MLFRVEVRQQRFYHRLPLVSQVQDRSLRDDTAHGAVHLLNAKRAELFPPVRIQNSLSDNLLIHHPHIQILGSMHTQRDRQFNICGTAWTCDKDKIVMVLGFGKDLVHICAQHFGAYDC